MREVDFTKKRLQQELEDKLEAEQQSKRQLERRVRLTREQSLCLHGHGEHLKAGRPGRNGEGWLVSLSCGANQNKLLLEHLGFPGWP